MSTERSLIITRLGLIGEDYGLTGYIQNHVEKLGHKTVSELPASDLVSLYDEVLCKIYQ
jgi:hypothetical protein